MSKIFKCTCGAERDDCVDCMKDYISYIENIITEIPRARTMNLLKLRNKIARVVIDALQHFYHIDTPKTFEETQGAVDRYRNDPRFKAKIEMLVDSIMAAVVKQIEEEEALHHV